MIQAPVIDVGKQDRKCPCSPGGSNLARESDHKQANR